ncbi:MAG: Ig-like domain-containing protein, partial [Myxococcales bacterium]
MRRTLVVALAVLACSQTPRAAPPGAPTGVSAHAGDGQVTVLWNPVDGALGYRLYLGEAALSSHTDAGNVVSWTQVGLTNGHEYSFAVSALGTGGESPLSATVTATPQANPALAVTGVMPADGSAAVPRNAPVVVRFNKAAQGVSATSALLSDDGFATSAAGAWAAGDGGATWTFTPSALLHASATYQARITTAVTDAGGIALPAQFTSAGFTTAPAMTATIAPAGTVGLLRPQITVTFSHAVAPATVTGACSGGSVTLSGGGSCVAMTASVSGNVATFTPAADLAPGTAYTVSVTTAVTDTDGVPLDAPASGGFTTASALVRTGGDLQHLALTWALPSAVTESRVYVRPAGGSYTTYTSIAAPAASATVGPLMPGKTWDVKVTTVNAGVESSGAELPGLTTDFAGTAAEWLVDQVAGGEKSGQFAFTWNDSEFFAGYLGALSSANGDALWIAFDIDPDSDTSGEVRTKTSLAATPEIIWPFKADYVVELKSGAANLRDVSAATWSPLAGAGVKQTGAISEVRFPLGALGSPPKVRFALAAIGTNTGYTFDLAPPNSGNPQEVPTLAYLASLTASFESTLAPAAYEASALEPLAAAPARVHITLVDPAPVGPLQIAGSIAPLSYDLSLSDYQLQQGGPGSYDGYFNFGGQAGELFFKFADDGATEPLFLPGKDRVFTLSGAAQTVPELIWNTVFGVSHAFTLVFSPSGGSEIRGGVDELGNWGTTAGPAPGAVLFTSHDFTAAPLEFKAWFGPNPSDYEGGTNHTMNDDVINTRTLTWTAGDSSTF